MVNTAKRSEARLKRVMIILEALFHQGIYRINMSPHIPLATRHKEKAPTHNALQMGEEEKSFVTSQSKRQKVAIQLRSTSFLISSAIWLLVFNLLPPF